VAQLAELKEKIDELALRLVMTDSDAPAAALAYLSALEAIRDGASPQAPAVSAAASALLSALPGAVHPAAVLSDGLAALEYALEQSHMPELPQSTATSLVSPAQDPELMNDFILESSEHLTNIECQVLTL
jgi:hypothetical protein